METSKVISTDQGRVVIQVNPQGAQNAVLHDYGQARGAYRNAALTKFFKAQPQALGTVQIMIGVMVFLFGIIRTTNVIYNNFPSISVVSGITYWGSFIYISAGSLSVAAQNKLHPCVVKASLGMNVISAITAGLTFLLMAIEIVLISANGCYYGYGYGRTHDICFNVQGYNLGIPGVLLIFSVLQLIISICISAFACKATCNRDSSMVSVALNQGY